MTAQRDSLMNEIKLLKRKWAEEKEEFVLKWTEEKVYVFLCPIIVLVFGAFRFFEI